MSKIKQRIGLVFALASLFALSVCSQAFAVAQDYSAVTDDAATEITAAVPIALATVGLFVGIMLAYKLVRRMIRA